MKLYNKRQLYFTFLLEYIGSGDSLSLFIAWITKSEVDTFMNYTYKTLHSYAMHVFCFLFVVFFFSRKNDARYMKELMLFFFFFAQTVDYVYRLLI